MSEPGAHRIDFPREDNGNRSGLGPHQPRGIFGSCPTNYPENPGIDPSRGNTRGNRFSNDSAREVTLMASCVST